MNLVTGGTGLVGSHLLLELLNKNQKVRTIYRDKSKIDLVERIFSHYTPNSKELVNQIDWVKGDILDVCSLEDAGKDVEFIYHAAAMVSFNLSDKNQLFKTNIEGTANVVNMALNSKIKKFCYVSSTAAIGNNSNGVPTNESFEWKKDNDTSNYSISKYFAEQEVWRGIEEGLDAVIVNPCIILGPGQIGQSSCVLFELIEKGLKFYTKGSNAFVDVRDVTKAMYQLMKSNISNDRFLVTSENISYQNLLGQIAKKLHKNSPNKELKKWMSEILWRISYVQSKFTGKKPWISKEDSRSAQTRVQYSSNKILSSLENFKFIPVEKAIDNTANFILGKKNDV